MRPFRTDRQLLIIAPTLFECAKAAEANGMVPGRIENFRNVTRAHALRGISVGTPFIAINRDSWSATKDGHDLDVALAALQRQGRVRLAQPDDIAAHCEFDASALRQARLA
jgi:hypothetical protein